MSKNGSNRRGNIKFTVAALMAGAVLMLALLSAAQTPKPLAATPPLSPDIDRKHQKTCLSAGCHVPHKTPGVPQHPPFREGRCLVCHEDHATSRPGLLKPMDNALCQSCHTGMALTTATAALAHPPGAKRCIDCHNPHESRERNLLRGREQVTECAACHADFLKEAAKLPYRHHYLDPTTECGSCHYAHRRPGEHYLRENVSETCLTCHDMAINLGSRVLENVADRINRAPVVHGAVAQGACPKCHTPHGSKQPSLLKEGYPAGSHEAYRSENFNLCWQCHGKALAESPRDASATRFRNGDENLHFRHVVTLKRGRACHLCHTAHASESHHLLRDTVTFGKWQSKLIYKPLPEGGSCQTPCHQEKAYKRR